MRRLPASLPASLAVVLALTLLAGCGGVRPDPQPQSGTEVRQMQVDGVERSYRVYAPDQLADDPALVVMLHGGFGSGRQAESAYGWDELADREGFVVAFPDSLNRAWNAGDCCGQSAENDVDDVAFLTRLVAELQDEFEVSADRTFATGMSNGAMMSYRLACETDVFAAIAPVAGTIVTECTAPAPVSVLHIHGALDTSVPIDGSPGSGFETVDGLPVADAVATFADGCGEPTVVTEGVVTTQTRSCDDSRTLTLVVIADAGHQWPGGRRPERAGADAPSSAYDATAQIWTFFDAA